MRKIVNMFKVKIHVFLDNRCHKYLAKQWKKPRKDCKDLARIVDSNPVTLDLLLENFQSILEHSQEILLLEFVLVEVGNLGCRPATIDGYTCIYVCS